HDAAPSETGGSNQATEGDTEAGTGGETAGGDGRGRPAAPALMHHGFLPFGEPAQDTRLPACDWPVRWARGAPGVETTPTVPATPAVTEQDFLPFGEAAQDIDLQACEWHVWWVAAAQGVKTKPTFSASATVEVAISHPDVPSFAVAIHTATLYQPGSVEFVSP